MKRRLNLFPLDKREIRPHDSLVVHEGSPVEAKNETSRTRGTRQIAALVLTAAVVMGLPTLRGGFVGGDDHRLVVDHVLVNHPTLEHAIQIFSIVHRDLYQPLPLLTFSMEFAIAKCLGLWKTGPQGGAWLFHLTNILLHSLNALLVWRVIMMLEAPRKQEAANRIKSTPARDLAFNGGQPAMAVATAAALVFAVHPLGVETVSWVNGRMMLLSTLFGLLSLLAFAKWLAKDRAIDAVLVLLCVVLSSISKVRVGLPLLLGLVAVFRGEKLRLRFWPLFIGAAAITGLFIWINIGATAEADLFSEAAEHLQGPRAVRVLLALGNYFTHFVWPVGLTSYYPTPPIVNWSDPETIEAAWIVALGLGLMAWGAWHLRSARWGAIWFFVAIADTLPFIPARNVLAADRYTYLPIVGLVWLVASTGFAIVSRWSRNRVSIAPRVAVVALLIVLLPTMIGMSWYTARWYDTPSLKTERIARVFPEVPRVWERFGWTQYSDGKYDIAFDLAKRELVHDVPAVRSGAYQLMGMCRFKQNHIDEALGFLHKALQVDPTNDLARFRLGIVYDELGRETEALPLLEACVASAPSHNPTIHRLANLYRRIGRPDDARKMYEKELENNPFEVPATMALADMDFSEQTPDGFHRVEKRLLNLLEWMPENVAARVNLAHLYDSMGDAGFALQQFSMAERSGFESIEQAGFFDDFLEKQGNFARAVDLWAQYVQHHPTDPQVRAMLAWSLVMVEQASRARAEIASLGVDARDIPMAQATVLYLALGEGKDDVVTALADRLGSGDASSAPARRRLLSALERFDQRHPDIPWTYYATAAMLLGEGRTETARVFIDLFAANCHETRCAEQRSALESRLPADSSARRATPQ